MKPFDSLTDYVGRTAVFLIEAHEPERALDTAAVFSRIAFERGDFSHHQYWKFVFDRIEDLLAEREYSAATAEPVGICH